MANSQKCSDFKLESIGGTQMHGMLMKKPVGHESKAWQKRFFVLKEGFLFYYAEAEKRNYVEKGIFNIHPKGVIPLGYCIVEECFFPGVNYGINVTYPDGSNAIFLGAEDEDLRKLWIEAMDVAAKITLENCSLGEAMIKSLQEQSLQLARERQSYYNKYMQEAKEHGEEKMQREVLEEFNQQLSEEKFRIQSLVDELQLAQEAIKRELKETTEAFMVLEEDRTKMLQLNKGLESSILEIFKERNEITKQLRDYESSGKQAEEETAELQQQLEKITKAAEKLETEKTEVEEKLKDNEKKMEEYSKEKNDIKGDVDVLLHEIQDLNQEKQDVEVKLKEEAAAKVQLQQQLNECREALERLEARMPDINQHELSDDFKSLKAFFENFAVQKSADAVNQELISRRRFSRRYTHIKKLRLSRPVDVEVPIGGYRGSVSSPIATIPEEGDIDRSAWSGYNKETHDDT